MDHVDKLVSIGSEGLGPALTTIPQVFEAYPGGEELFRMLRKKNGFYAFEQALHVFPLKSDITETMTLEDWNSQTLWRSAYDDLTKGLLFFAEDVFGDQFCMSSCQCSVLRFDAERGETAAMADSIEKWADAILSDYAVQTGWPLAKEWQEKNGALPLGARLQPKIPFVYGGEYALDNLWQGDAVEGMLFKGEIALKIRNLPPGTQIRFEVKR
jgi:hypothetical protein